MAIQPLLLGLAIDAAGAVTSTAAAAIGQSVSFADVLRQAAAEHTSATVEKNDDREPAVDAAGLQVAGEHDSSQVTTYLEAIRRTAESAQQRLLEKFRNLASGANLDPKTEFALQLDGSGNLQSLSDDPAVREIEELAARDPETTKLITDLIDANRVLRAADEYPSFRDAYQRDPLLAVAQYSHLFDGADEPVLSVRPTAGEVSIDRY